MMRERHNHLLRFSQVNKHVGRNFPGYRMAPAHQYFNTANAQGISFDYRLINNIELIVFYPQQNGFTRIGFQRQHVVTHQACQQTAHDAEQQRELCIFREPAVGIEIDLQRHPFDLYLANGLCVQALRVNKAVGQGGKGGIVDNQRDAAEIVLSGGVKNIGCQVGID